MHKVNTRIIHRRKLANREYIDWVVCSTPHALSPHTLSPHTLSPRALSPHTLTPDGLSEKFAFY